MTASTTCTSGFTVSVDGVSGVLTAMHRPNGLGWWGPSGVIQYQNAASPHSSDRYIDLQWHRVLSGNTSPPVFRARSDQERAVATSQNAVVGDVVCNFGQGTGEIDCTQVHGYTIDLTWCGLANTEDNITAAGNSGGPWFIGGTAFGIHSGSHHTITANRSLFTPQSRVAENLDGKIKRG